MSCEHREYIGDGYFCGKCQEYVTTCAKDLRARLDAAEKRATEAEAIANEALRVGLETCESLRDELKRTRCDLVTAYSELAGGYEKERK